ncbi:MAG: type II secretion system F family protein [Candidatus Thermoplasmatota archaeon]|nr:type II secretion system F family protein [Candidatus Thermoplasmatota archaeon]
MKTLWKSKAYDLKKVYGSDIPMQIILVISLLVTLLLFIIGFLSFIGMTDTSFTGLTGFDLMVFAVLSAIGPIGFYNYIKTKRIMEIQDHLPDFLREICGSTASGMTVFDAIISAAQADHGKLSPEIQRIAAQLSWGISVHDALKNFAKRINTDVVKRMTITINKALEIGGNTSSVFEAAAKEIDQAKRVEMQRKAEMSMYSIVIFISFFVFLAVILIINKTIFTAIFDLQDQMAGQAIGNMQIARIDEDLLKYSFFSFVLVQSIGGGLLGGFMMDGRLSSGVRFGFILVLVSFFVFKFLF